MAGGQLNPEKRVGLRSPERQRGASDPEWTAGQIAATSLGNKVIEHRSMY